MTDQLDAAFYAEEMRFTAFTARLRSPAVVAAYRTVVFSLGGVTGSQREYIESMLTTCAADDATDCMHSSMKRVGRKAAGRLAGRPRVEADPGPRTAQPG
jgi:hypothetical protein